MYSLRFTETNPEIFSKEGQTGDGGLLAPKEDIYIMEGIVKGGGILQCGIPAHRKEALAYKKEDVFLMKIFLDFKVNMVNRL